MGRTVLAVLILCTAASLAHAQEPPRDAPAAAGGEAAAKILVGPIVGHVGPDEALLWLHGPGVKAVVVRDGERTRTLPVTPLGFGCGLVRVHGLTPATEVALEVGLPGNEPAAALRFRTAPLPSTSGRVRFAVGSCIAYPNPAMWDVVRAQDPDFMLWLGDNTYYRKRGRDGGDWDRPEWMLQRHLDTRRLPTLIAAAQRMASYAVWDDHDYGPNNSDGSFPNKAASRAVHRAMWANPSYGESEEGVYGSFRRGPVEVFLLDDRWFKQADASVSRANKRLYGQRQLEWLRRGLRASDAPLKVIAGGVQHLFGYPGAEGWHDAPGEREGFLRWLRAEPVGPVLFLSGDLHVSELYQVPLAPGQTTWELTSSGMAQGGDYVEMFRLLEREERKWVVTEPNVCVVEVDIPADPARRGEATLRFTSYGAHGDVLAETRATFESFGTPRPKRRSF